MEETKLDGLTNEQICFQLILHSGNARSKVMESLKKYRNNSVEEAEELLVQAEQDLQASHEIHFKMVQKEAGGEKSEFSLLLMHAEDHLMSTLTMKELVTELLKIFKEKNL
ncbi:PTS lactose/cellobiose transporter subunit IIA [Bacillus sp. CLL-7-23]|uniref:PTS lactose/cellobiose transporter subunit IIA n=1 Tax=Bacillus changyiensis TaxID=3004103 RepID=A0ABT4X4C3_9BACI|nr:PTS lactose/cellobiose transporter subunit IIA [Bacillus changyiensis]MDA7027038.1 PTS lactose/cellobiose transporter subunit IIA [Bacillus changyiensis]